jgi:mRNA interferase RelE/StbE
LWLYFFHERTKQRSKPGELNMDRAIEIRDKAEKDLRSVPKRDSERILNAIQALRADLQGDVKKLTNFSPSYRLRVGNWRVLFEVERDKVIVYRVLNRKDAYKG